MPMNVLVVDDSAVMRAMVTRTLRLSGLPLGEVLQAGDGVAALRTLGERPVDLMLVDINMPVMNGLELIARVREDAAIAGTPIVVVSTESSLARIAAIREQGLGFVHKPFTPERLRYVVLTQTGLTDESQLAGTAAQGDGLDF